MAKRKSVDIASQHIINFILGDPCADGHGLSKSFSVESNFTEKEIKAAYKLGVRMIGCDVTQICNDFEDNKISEEFVKILLEFGFEPKAPAKGCRMGNWNKVAAGKDDVLYPEDYIQIYLYIAGKGNLGFEWSEVAKTDVILGGYGLFSR